MSRVARMYHEQGLRQAQIADALHISQPRVSRLVKRAAEIGIVRTTVALPDQVHTDLEERVERRYGLQQAVIVDASGHGADVTRAIGAAAADYLGATLIGGDTVGISSWSASLIAAVSVLPRFRTPVVDTAVQLVGGLGDPRVQLQATRLMEQFALRTGAEPVLLPTPGVLGTASARLALMADPTVANVTEVWSRLTLALVGVGALEPSDLARESGNAFPERERVLLREAGAVGDVCFRFYDSEGTLVDTEFNERVIGISPSELRAVERRVGVAGGSGKVGAIRAAMLGGWINVLVTDLVTAELLLA